MLRKIPFIMLGLVVVVIGVSFVLKSCDTNQMPAVNSARYEIKADNHVFYTDSYSQGFDRYGQYITLLGYWQFDGTAWSYTKTSLYLSYRGYKEVLIRDRTN